MSLVLELGMTINNLSVNIENHKSPPAIVCKGHSTTKDISNFCHDLLFMTIRTIKSGQKSPEIIFNKSTLKSTSKFALNFLLYLTDCPMHCQMDRLTNHLTNHLTTHLTDPLTDCLTDRLIKFIPALICVVWLCRSPGVSSLIVSVCLENCVASSLCLVSFFLSVIKKPS